MPCALLSRATPSRKLPRLITLNPPRTDLGRVKYQSFAAKTGSITQIAQHGSKLVSTRSLLPPQSAARSAFELHDTSAERSAAQPSCVPFLQCGQAKTAVGLGTDPEVTKVKTVYDGRQAVSMLAVVTKTRQNLVNKAARSGFSGESGPSVLDERRPCRPARRRCR